MKVSVDDDLDGGFVLETRDLTKRYGETMRVRRGEVYGFLGPNG